MTAEPGDALSARAEDARARAASPGASSDEDAAQPRSNAAAKPAGAHPVARPLEPTEPAADPLHASAHALADRLRTERDRFEARQQVINEKSGRNLLSAILVGLGLAALLLVSLLVWKPLFIVTGGVLVGLLLVELATAMRKAGLDVPRIPSLVLGIAVVPFSYFFGAPGMWLAIIGACALLTLYRLIEQAFIEPRPTTAELWRDIAAGIFTQLYISMFANLLVVLTAQDGGEWWVVSMITIVVVCDTGAYVTGLNLGRHKLAPRISPGKTWEGFFGAVACSLVAGGLLGSLLLGLEPWAAVLMGACIAGTATTGDLLESLIKRDLGVKDISGWLPGHGGLLDRADSMLPSTVVIFTFASLHSFGLV